MDSAVTADEIPVNVGKRHIVGADRKLQRFGCWRCDGASQSRRLIAAARGGPATDSGVVWAKKVVVDKGKSDRNAGA